jgi:hypothetical protein
MSEDITEVVEPKKKKRVNSKSKGSGFERVVSKHLEKAAAPLHFRRTQMSGAILGGKNWEKEFAKWSPELQRGFIGDVVPTDESENCKFNFVVECKNYANREHMDLLFDKSLIYVWLKEAEHDAAKLGIPGILICKWNNTPIYACARFDLPTEKKIHILEGVQVCRLEDIIDKRDFWITEKVT